MMDKIVVTAADIEKLLAWRDEHNDLVRSMPVPLREVEIQIVESGISIKCFRSDKKLKLYLDSPARKLGHVVFAPLGNGLWKKKVSTLPADCNPTETEQGALTVYGSLMALMTYGAVGIRGEKSATSTKAPAKRIGSTKPHTANTTYIIHSAGKQLTVVLRGHHASPACSFTVRGHFRHYKSGKTVWIAEYRKGTGHSRGKTYKIGGDLDDEQSEWQFIIDYVKDSTTDFCNATCRSQLMALWTAYCMHNDLCVDTKMYDATLFDLWLAVSLERRRALRIFRFSEFDSWMSQRLV